MPKGVKDLNAKNFDSSIDGASIKNCVATIENHFDLIQTTYQNQQTRFAKTLLDDRPRFHFKHIVIIYMFYMVIS